MVDLFCLGEPLIEFNQQNDNQYLKSFGGDVSNVAIAAVRQGVTAGMLTCIGGDSFGHDLLRLWATEGVCADHVILAGKGETGLYFVTHDEQGHHFEYRRKYSAASQYCVENLPATALKSCRIFYASGISLAIGTSVSEAVLSAATIVKAAGGVFAFDPNLRLALWPLEQAKKTIHKIMEKCDIALPSLDDARELTSLDSPENIVHFYHDIGAKTVVLTLGDHGAILSDGNEQHIIPPCKVDALDATGAGDCFNGTFLAARLSGSSMFDAACWVNASAALSTCGYGAVPPIPTFKQTQKHFIRTGI